ncbi:cysteine desulfurase [Raphidocelis subcapitata]|uniref:Cysteine desulfurase n=1 Tax=Raphidocelis subcapitata TaxID=307507 RepID=A0A2V0PAY6_9CHLO|nr:cysteine desulfurase [Raphidocelis subcapitata]|eukprot:GBF95040.1 cysteine desulfurase [Raphidocelis subcapitata]
MPTAVGALAAEASAAAVAMERSPQQQQLQRTSGVGVPLPHAIEPIYLDYNATTPVFPEAAEAMRPFLLEGFGNPSSGHAYGRRTAAAVAAARASVAALVGAAGPDEVHFCGCGTEADAWAIEGAVFAARRRGAARPHVVTSAIEHPAVLATLAALEERGLACYTAVPVSAEGLVDPRTVAAAVRPGETVLVTVGSIQPIAEIAEVARAAGALMHTDAAQSIGKARGAGAGLLAQTLWVEVDVGRLGVDALTIVGHKFGAPKGMAALYIRRGVQLDSLLFGGGQEHGRRAGTESVLLIAGLGAAAEAAQRELPALASHMRATRAALAAALLSGLPPGAARVNGPADGARRLPNTLSVSLRGVDAGALLAGLGDRVAASAAAACHSAAGGAASHVLRAMGAADDADYARGALRLSTGRHTTAEEAARAAALIRAAAAEQNAEFAL